MKLAAPTKSGNRQVWGNALGAARSFYLAQLAAAANNPILIITPTSLLAQQLLHELKFFCSPETTIMEFPDWEILPYDNFSPHQDIISDRLKVLYSIGNLKSGIIIAPATTLMHRLCPPSFISSTTFIMQVGETLDLTNTKRQLSAAGYSSVSQVMSHGEFAVRGSIFDIFPMGSNVPFRLDLFDDEIDSIRTFVPETQKSIDKIDKIELLPAREFPLTEEAIAKFRTNWRSKFSGNPANSVVYQNISNATIAPGIEYYLSLFFDETASFFEYLPNNATICLIEDVHAAANELLQQAQERQKVLRLDIDRPALEPDLVFLKTDEFFQQVNNFPQIKMQATAIANNNFSVATLPDLTLEAKSSTPLKKLEEFIANAPQKILFCVESRGRREILLEVLKQISLTPKNFESWQQFTNSAEKFGITIAPIDSGCWLQAENLILISENEIMGGHVMQRRRRKSQATQNPETIIKNLAELKIGDLVVHIQHGVGCYKGLTTLTVDNIDAEFVTLEYAGNDKLYVPVSSLHLLNRYSAGENKSAQLHRLGHDAWKKAKKKAQSKVNDVAVELLELYAKRAARQGFSFKQPDSQYLVFANSFPFETTPDQQQAIEAVINDMQAPTPMDRLICGDVGFGKTEVALRAAFIAAMSGKQTAMLVPTTLLTEQHFQTFRDRFADWPIKVEALSRFRTAKEQERIIDQLLQGKVDIVIGTHKLIQKNIKIKNLGLVIIDEEHRFGVKQKERLKSLRQEVDILTLTATPIPRTLNMSMAGIRDISIISTPPAKRLAIKTFVRDYSEVMLREAVIRELRRGGQIYYLHNDVSTIEATMNKLKEIVPEANINFAHGQMPERMLEQVMTDFYHQRFNVLVCTTIIETGIDVPTANTIVINRADKFGLAQLHQLRGRVGRSHHQAYAYMFTPNKKLLTSDAKKRLEAISNLEDLGAGFMLATHDLEIRGAGEILGEEQSGDMEAVGYSLFMEMLESAIKQLKSGKKLSDIAEKTAAEINLHVAALIPSDYLPDVSSRLTLYKRIANANTDLELKDIKIEMIDRFGILPEEINNLFTITKLKIKASAFDISSIDIGNNGGSISFSDQPNINIEYLISLIQKQPHVYKLDNKGKFSFKIKTVNLEQRLKVIDSFLENLALPVMP